MPGVLREPLLGEQTMRVTEHVKAIGLLGHMI
jgi:hypothetical protein